MKLRVTVCELMNAREDLEHDLGRLVTHARVARSDLILLPEMGLAPWFAETPDFDPAVWKSAVAAHDEAIGHFDDLAQAIVVGSRPVNSGSKRLNEGFVWERDMGYRAAHHKYYLPKEPGYREADWYDRGSGDFTPVQASKVKIGMMICSELWFFHRAREYGKQGAQIIACPRATPAKKYSKWLAGGRAAAVVSGAFSISSCPVNPDSGESDLGGHGWIVGPESEIIAETSACEPFVTAEIDLSVADRAKQTYPRYIPD
ncbi:MAG: carbon-nitrogen hydrolase family protein [bacterium]